MIHLNRRARSLGAALLAVVALSLVACIAPAMESTMGDGNETVTLAWERAGEPVAGYKVHYGTTSGVYDHVADAGNSTGYTVTGLQTGVTYYFAATSYNSSGSESGYSNVVSVTT